MILGMFLIAFNFVSCNKDDDNGQTNRTERQFGIFKVLNDITIEMEGDITSSIVNDYNSMIAAYPNVNKINMKNCPGSADDTANLQVARSVHERGMSIHITDNSEIASGAVDFFVAGTQRTKGKNVKIGVHAWGGEDAESATDYPVGHTNHLPYINYYVSVGFTQQQAEDFYYFTINAAPASGIHWMTEEEITKYNLITN